MKKLLLFLLLLLMGCEHPHDGKFKQGDFVCINENFTGIVLEQLQSIHDIKVYYVEYNTSIGVKSTSLYEFQLTKGKCNEKTNSLQESNNR